MLGPRFEEALTFASRLHREQTRKHSTIPYVAHLLAVCSLVLEHNGDESQAIAALLHDGPEDQGGEATLAEIRSRFGDDVGDLVAACGEPLHHGKSAWRDRKETFLEHLASVSPRALLVIAADKVHNARCIVGDHAVIGGEIFNRFNGGVAGTKWYYRQLVAAFERRAPSSLTMELADLADRIDKLSGPASP
jgi:(p)ppGpp synthase/HD superfamily hydrolase